MPFLAAALALAALQAPASNPPVFMAVLAETASGFESMADCEKSLGPAKRGARRGSLFNRKAGNISRCQMVDGEPMIVVIPRALATSNR